MTKPSSSQPPRRPVPVAPTEERWRAMTPAERERFLVEVLDALSDPQIAMSEGRPHAKAKSKAIDMLGRHFRAMGRRIYLAEDLAVVYPGEASFCPDILAVLDVEEPEDDQRMAWVVADEGKGLDWVLEVLWAGDRKKDLVDNVERYAALGIPEYFVYDRGRQRLHGYHLAGSKRYQPIVPQHGLYHSAVLGLDLAIIENSLRFYQGTAELYDTAHLIRRLEGIVQNLEARSLEAETQVERALAGLRQGIKTILTARGVSYSAENIARLDTCTDPEILATWLQRASIATSEEEVFQASSDKP